MTLEKYVPVEDPLSIEGKISLNFLEKYPLKMNDLSSSFEKTDTWNLTSQFKFVLEIDQYNVPNMRHKHNEMFILTTLYAQRKWPNGNNQ